MSKFCGNCGAQLDDAAKVCGNCGTPLEPEKASNTSIPGISYGDPEKKNKIKKNIKLFSVLAVIVVIAIIAVNIISGFVGYKGAVRRIMNAYENYDMDTIVSMASNIYYSVDKNSSRNHFSSIISNDLDNYEEQLGRKYKLSYEITDSYEMSERKYDELMDALSYYSEFDAESITKIMVVEIDVTAEEGRDSIVNELKLTLSKEDGFWTLLEMQ